MIKLLRTHVMASNGGLLIPNNRGGMSLLSRRTFEELLALQTGDFRVCFRLDKSSIQVRDEPTSYTNLYSFYHAVYVFRWRQ